MWGQQRKPLPPALNAAHLCPIAPWVQPALEDAVRKGTGIPSSAAAVLQHARAYVTRSVPSLSLALCQTLRPVVASQASPCGSLGTLRRCTYTSAGPASLPSLPGAQTGTGSCTCRGAAVSTAWPGSQHSYRGMLKEQLDVKHPGTRSAITAELTSREALPWGTA